MQPPAVTEIVTFLYTQDLPSTAAFYEEVLGFPLALDQRSCRIYKITPGGYLGFCTRADVVPDHPDIIFTLVTPQVDQWYDYLISQGVDFVKPPAENGIYQIYHCFFRDPNGYLIEIQQFKDPDWPPNRSANTQNR